MKGRLMSRNRLDRKEEATGQVPCTEQGQEATGIHFVDSGAIAVLRRQLSERRERNNEEREAIDKATDLLEGDSRVRDLEGLLKRLGL